MVAFAEEFGDQRLVFSKRGRVYPLINFQNLMRGQIQGAQYRQKLVELQLVASLLQIMDRARSYPGFIGQFS